MHIAINTASLAPNTTDALNRAAKLGFSHIEINLLTEEFAYGYRRKPNVRFYRNLKKQLADLNLNVFSVTTPPLTQAQMFDSRARRDVIHGAAGAAGILGAQVFVTRPADILTSEEAVTTYFDVVTAPPIISGYDELWAQVVNRRLNFTMLNQAHWLGIPLTNHVDNIAKLTADLAIGFAMDIRSASRRGTIDTWLQKMGDRLAVAYIYDGGEETPYQAPMADDWQEWLPPFTTSRLSAIVMQADFNQTDDQLLASRDYLQGILNNE
ncbi:MAG TPA: hypothetical protein VLL52_05270 [Anaerolineae bacterium]|nr:hypothetical protein [Anaerolineae bacterium]